MRFNVQVEARLRLRGGCGDAEHAQAHRHLVQFGDNINDFGR